MLAKVLYKVLHLQQNWTQFMVISKITLEIKKINGR